MARKIEHMDQAAISLLAYDISDLIDKFEYPIDADPQTIERLLPDFLRALGVQLPDFQLAPAPDPEFVRHNHDDGKALPFGRLKPAGQCPRCDQLRAGAAPREAPHGIREKSASWTSDYDRRRREHFAQGGPHARGVCGPVCTAFDY